MRRALALAGLACLWLTLSAAGAGAHALLRSSTPEDGALLESAPPEIAITFSEPPDLGLSSVEVVDASGGAVETGEMQTAGSDREVRVSLPGGLPDGVYTVSWRVLSRVDGHVTAGAFAFGVGVAEVAPAGEGEGAGVEYPDPTFLSVAGRWAFYWGLALLLGGALGALVLFRDRPAGFGWLLAGGWVLAMAGLAGMLAAEADEAGIGVTTLLGSDRGELLLLRAGALGVAGVAALTAALSRARGWAWALGGTAAAAMLIHAYAGHAGAAEDWRALAVGVQWMHILAVGVWIGGLGWLLLGLLGGPRTTVPQREYSRNGTDSVLEREYSRSRTGSGTGGGVGSAVGRFSAVAGYALAVVAVTGFLRAWQEVGSIGALFDTGFGLAAAGKSALFVGLLGIGAYNRFRVVPAVVRAGERVRTLRRTVSGELAIAAGVFGLTGLMAGLVPPATVEATPPPPPERVVVSGSDFATTMRVRLAATPGTAGPNRFEVRIRDFDSGEPVEARAVTLRFSLPERADVGASELALERAGPGRWRGQGTNLSVAGTWRVGVLIQQAADSAQIDLELQTRAVEPEVRVIEGGPGQPGIYEIGLPGGGLVQGYVDPGEAGAHEVHFTFFDAEGSELSVGEATITATPEGGDTIGLEPRRLSPGHFVAGAELEPGPHRFAIEAETEEGMVLTAAFEEEVG